MLSNEDLMEIDNAPRNNNTKLDIFLANINYIVDFFDKNEIDKENSNCNIAIQSYPKYLTNSELFNLELNDSSFRKTILIQFIIVLSSFIKPISQNQKKIFVFPKSISEKITNELNHCVTVLKKSNQKVLNILNDETVWEKWKENGCSTPFEKFPDENLKKLFNDTNTKFSKRKKIVVDGCPLNNLFNFEKEFNIDMNDIYNININFEIESIFNQVPFIGTFVEKVLSDADPTLEIEEKQRIINLDKSFSWKFLRLLSHNDITRLNNDKNSKVISICEDYFNKYKTKEVSNLTLFPQPAPAPPAPPKEKIVVNTNNLPPISNNSSTTNNTTVVITTTTEKKQITAVPSAHKEKEKISISKEDNKHDNSNHSNGRDKDKNRDHYLHKKRSADRNNTQSSNKKHKF